MKNRVIQQPINLGEFTRQNAHACGEDNANNEP